VGSNPTLSAMPMSADRRVTARVIRHAELDRFQGQVNTDGGDVRLLQGEDVGLTTSVFHSQVAPGGGPRRHRHPHAEIFVLHDGQGRYEVDGTLLDAEAGDIVIVPPDTWHTFVNVGTSPLRQTAVHEAPRAVTGFEDGSRRD
jgi:quercetin dioxygenase-like cupin family protein